MKFKFEPDKGNKLLMISIIFLCFITCFMWLTLREYIYFTIYTILSLLITYTYFGTYYYLKDKHLVTRMGFIIIKISYNKIREVNNLKDKVKLTFKRFSINIYPQNKDLFVVKLNSKLTNKNSCNIILEK